MLTVTLADPLTVALVDCDGDTVPDTETGGVIETLFETNGDLEAEAQPEPVAEREDVGGTVKDVVPRALTDGEALGEGRTERVGETVGLSVGVSVGERLALCVGDCMDVRVGLLPEGERRGEAEGELETDGERLTEGEPDSVTATLKDEREDNDGDPETELVKLGDCVVAGEREEETVLLRAGESEGVKVPLSVSIALAEGDSVSVGVIDTVTERDTEDDPEVKALALADTVTDSACVNDEVVEWPSDAVPCAEALGEGDREGVRDGFNDALGKFVVVRETDPHAVAVGVGRIDPLWVTDTVIVAVPLMDPLALFERVPAREVEAVTDGEEETVGEVETETVTDGEYDVVTEVVAVVDS